MANNSNTWHHVQQMSTQEIVKLSNIINILNDRVTALESLNLNQRN